MKIKYIQWKAVVNNKVYQSPKLMINAEIVKADCKNVSEITAEHIKRSLEALFNLLVKGRR